MEEKAIILSVRMGYGHQRTAHNLSFLGKVININESPLTPPLEKMVWNGASFFYHSLSSFKSFPFFGSFIFGIFNYLQRIDKFYPKKEMISPTFYLKILYQLIRKGWGRDFIFKIKDERKPLISTFFLPAFMAEVWGYPHEIFCVVCDSDISRAWAPLFSKKSRIKYFASTERVVERLKLYGVKEENIFFTGYPLPLRFISEEEVKKAFLKRILNLDPQKKFLKKYHSLIQKKIGFLADRTLRPLSFLFSLGGAAAQKELALLILNSLKKKILNEEICFVISVGINQKARAFFQKEIKKIFSFFPKNVEILFSNNIEDYFNKFDLRLLQTDILITKPSELSFYSSLGISLLLLPPIGYQEIFNKDWLLKNGFAIEAKKLEYFSDWFFDFLNEGFFAKAAFFGFYEGKRDGCFEIEKIIC